MGRAASFRMLVALGAGIACAPASAQVRIVIDGQVQDVPDGVVRIISYAPGGRQIVHDEPFAGNAAPGAATVTTIETSEENEDGSDVRTTVVTRIEPIAAVAYAPPPPVVVAAPATPALAFAPDALDLPDEPSAPPRELRIRRDAETGHFITRVRINGVDVRAIVDTGAQTTILSAQDARATHADEAIVRSRPMAGIGGLTMLSVAHLRSVEVGGQRLGGFDAAIGQEGIPYTLLGQSEIARLGRIVIEEGVMTISPRATEVASR